MTESTTGDDDYLVKRVLGSFDVPAYVKRGLRLEAEERALLGRCASLRDKKLLRVKLAVITCWATLKQPEDLSPHCSSPTEFHHLLQLAELVTPERRPLAQRPASPRRIAKRLRQLIDEGQRFNETWRRLLDAIDLGPLNAMIADYNKFGLFERECAMRSVRLAAHGFQTRRPWDRADLFRHFPLLTIPRLNEPIT
jgi:hypothetical protein